MNPDNPRQLLSEAGAARHQKILAAAFREADRRQRRRVVRRGATSVCAAVALIGLSVFFARRHAAPSPPVIAVDLSTQPATTRTTRPITVSVTPPGVVVEFIPAGKITRRWEVIDDDQLLDALADAGQPSGIVRVGEKTVVMPLQ